MRDHSDDILEPEDSESSQAKASDANKATPQRPLDPNDVIPVPVAMQPAEIDKRAETVEALRDRKRRDRGDDDEGMR